MTHIATLRDDLASLHRNGYVDGPLRLFLGRVLDKIEELERPASAIRPGFFGELPGVGRNLEIAAEGKS